MHQEYITMTTTPPDTIGAAFVQALAPDQYPAYTDRTADREAAPAEQPPAPAPALSDGERSFLAYALDLTFDMMANDASGFGSADQAAYATLRKLAGGEQQAPEAAADPWAVVARLAAWLDDHNGSSTPETALRLMKVQEEAGEVAAAWIGVVGQNPRKGVTHTTGEVLGELCDVIVAAMVAMATLTEDPAARFAAKLAEIAGLRLDAAGGES
jgi:hypothetical protein